MNQHQRSLKILQIADFHGKTHVRLALFRLGIHPDHIEFFTREDF